MELIERTRCAVAHTPDLEPLHTFRDFPVFMGCTEQPASADLRADMSWSISRSSGLIQLRSLLPLEILYPSAHGAGCVGALWSEHHRAFARFLRRFGLSSVLELGGSHGILAREYDASGTVPWTIVEPNPALVPGSTVRVIRAFFGADFRYDGAFDAVVHSHLFEHIYAPDEFMAHLSRFMAAGKHLVFSMPNMAVMLRRKYTNCINFEHTVLLTEPYVEHLLARHGFRLLEKEYFRDDHSIFYAAVRDGAAPPVPLPGGLCEEHRELYREYLRYHERLVAALNERARASAAPVYLFGAHVFAQYLLAFGLDPARITCLLDNDPEKQGRRLYGTPLLVSSPRVLRDVARPAVILKAGVYNDEVRGDILRTVNADTVFWE